MTNARPFRFSFALALALVLAACGSPGDFQKPVQTFAEATAAAEKGLNGYLTAFDTQIMEAHIKAAAPAPVRVSIRDKECEVGSQRCRLDYRQSRDAEPVPLSYGSFENIPQILVQIRIYAEGLEAIATSESAEEAETNLAATSGDLKVLADLVDKDGELGAYSEPVAAAVGWLAGKYVERVQINALRAATTKADPLIQRASSRFEKIAEHAVRATNIKFVEAVSKRDAEYDEERNEAALNKFIEAAKAYDELLRTPPTRVFIELRESHSALTKALNSDEVSFSAAFAKLQLLKDDAQKLANIVKTLVAAAKSNGE